MDAVKVIKWVGKAAAGLGTLSIVNNIVRATSPRNISVVEKFTVSVAIFAISSGLASVAEREIDSIVDGAFEIYNKIKKQWKNADVVEGEVVLPEEEADKAQEEGSGV